MTPMTTTKKINWDCYEKSTKKFRFSTMYLSWGRIRIRIGIGINVMPIGTEYIFYCKRAILFLSSSKILIPHPPLRPASVYPPPLLRGRTDSPGGEGGGGQ